MSRNLILGAAFALATALAATPALAHNVVASAYPSGPVIEGEIGFSNGDMAKDAVIEVYGPDGTKLGETKTDAEGAFSYKPAQPVALEFRANLGAGHKADFSLSQEDVEQVIAMQKDVSEAKAEKTGTAPAATGSGMVTLSMEDKLAIAKMVRDEVKPVYKELAAYKEHNGLQTILGGIGYIIGLFGIGFYVAARRKVG